MKFQINSNKVYRHKLGESQDKDVLVFEEKDAEFNISISKSRTDKYLYINSSKTESNEIWLIELSRIFDQPKCVLSRSDKHLYYVEDTPDAFAKLEGLDFQI